MKVTRDADGAYLKPYKPPVSCSCYYEAVVTQMSAADCVPCAGDADCAGGKTCQSKFCE